MTTQELVAKVYKEFLNWIPPEVIGRMEGVTLFSRALEGFCTRYHIKDIDFIDFRTAGDHAESFLDDKHSMSMKVWVSIEGKDAIGKSVSFKTDYLRLGKMPLSPGWQVRLYIDDSIFKR